MSKAKKGGSVRTVGPVSDDLKKKKPRETFMMMLPCSHVEKHA
jgi:hypothetical protein